MRFQAWKIFSVLIVLFIGIIFSLPNIFPPDPSVQITTASAGDGFSNKFLDDLKDLSENTDINTLSFEKTEKSILIRTNSYQDQIELKDFLQKELNENFVVALNLAANTPDWLKALNAKPMKLGLDLRGGVNFLMEVDTELLIQTKLESIGSVIRNSLREERIKTTSIDIQNDRILVSLVDNQKTEAFTRIVNDLGNLNLNLVQNLNYELSFSDQEIDETIDYAVLQNLTTLRNRVNELGVSEPVVQREGRKRISVQLPGIQDLSLIHI